MNKKSKILSLYCDKKGNIFDSNQIPMFRSGKKFVQIDKNELIKLPYGSTLFSLPERYPVFFDSKTNKETIVQKDKSGNEIWALSSFLSSGYLRTYLPAYYTKDNAKPLSLWAYTGIVVIDNEYYVPAFRIDDDPRSDPELHENHEELAVKITKLKKIFPKNRLVNQLAYCSTEFVCLCARNFFLSRYEAPVPTSPACNANCVGCLSFQPNTDITSPQHRLTFKPTPEEIKEVILYHFQNVKKPIASFGQGCEGEPLLRADDLATAIKMVREKTDKGTINLNTNGSLPNNLKTMIAAGLDSIRVSLNSPTEKYYNSYFRPRNYKFEDVLKTIETAVESGIFVSINLFFLPGFTDSEKEVESLFNFLNKYKISMIQTRNLNIDPDYYFDLIDYEDSNHLGIKNLTKLINKEYPNIRLGYTNPFIGKI